MAGAKFLVNDAITPRKSNEIVGELAPSSSQGMASRAERGGDVIDSVSSSVVEEASGATAPFPEIPEVLAVAFLCAALVAAFAGVKVTVSAGTTLRWGGA
jgi:hypothetical protein